MTLTSNGFWHGSGMPFDVMTAASNWCGGRNFKVYMHRAILAAQVADKFGDHWNGNGLDNQRANLRPATPAQNQHNRKVQSNSTSGIKGAIKTGDLYIARIVVGGVRQYLGSFKTAEEAGAAYATASRVHHGAFSHGVPIR
jgi:hypothetical protein